MNLCELQYFLQFIIMLHIWDYTHLSYKGLLVVN